MSVVTWETERAAAEKQKGEWVRTPSAYQPDELGPIAADRYVVYGAHACPWASRIHMLIRLCGLPIDYVHVDPVFGTIAQGQDGQPVTGWVFSERFPDRLNGKRSLREVYLLGNPEHTGKSTTPLLFDQRDHRVVHNESVKMAPLLFDSFRGLCSHPEVDLYPGDLRDDIARFYTLVYGPLLNGVYRAGFSTSQTVLDEVTREMFLLLGQLDQRLEKQRYVMGERFTFADIMLFPTLLRFDAVYYIHFKCSFRRVQDFAALKGYVQDIWQFRDGVKEVHDLTCISQHYFESHTGINPTRLIARVDHSWLNQPHNRDQLPREPVYWFM